MRIILNFLPLKGGGGVQVGLDVLSQVASRGGAHRWFMVATADTPFTAEQFADVELVRTVPSGLGARLWFERHAARRLVRDLDADLVYTQFGPHWPACGSRNVVGCAYSNLFYPEVDFWAGYSWLEQQRRKLIDRARLARLRDADAVIFETEALAQRARTVLDPERQLLRCVRPTVSTLVSDQVPHQPTAARCVELPAGFRIVLLARYHRNKNIELVVQSARALRDAGVDDVRFIFTLAEDSDAARVAALAQSLGVADMVHNFGPVPYEGCGTLYRQCSAVILPSRLESFSNSIAEAWAMDLPLLISDMDWSRSICADAAQYLPIETAAGVAGAVADVRADARLRADLVSAGRRQLARYPSSAERFDGYLEVMEEVAQ